MSDLSSQNKANKLTPAQIAQIQAAQAQQAVSAGAPIQAIPTSPTTTYTDAQSIPGNPIGVAGQANPQIGNAVLPAGGNVPNVLIPKDQQKATNPPAPVAPVPVPKPEVTPIPLTPPQTVAAPVVAGLPKTDPIKEAASKPGFWSQVLDVANSTRKTLFELLGDIGAGSVHMTTPTQQRLEREQQLRLQGNEVQAQKDLAAANQGFNEQIQKLQIAHDTAMQAARNDLEKQQIENNFQLRRIEIENQRQMFQLNYRWNLLSQQGNTGGAHSFYKFGDQ